MPAASYITSFEAIGRPYWLVVNDSEDISPGLIDLDGFSFTGLTFGRLSVIGVNEIRGKFGRLPLYCLYCFPFFDDLVPLFCKKKFFQKEHKEYLFLMFSGCIEKHHQAVMGTGEPRRVLIPFDRYGGPEKSTQIIFLQHF